jgi:hypothetical protein
MNHNYVGLIDFVSLTLDGCSDVISSDRLTLFEMGDI